MKIRFVLSIFYFAFLVSYCVGTAAAQVTASARGGRQTDVFGELNLVRPGQGEGNTYGGTLGGFEQGRLFGVGVRGTIDPEGSHIHIYQATIGPRIAFHIPLVTVFGEFEGGLGHAGYRTGNTVTSSWGATWQANAGADWSILPHLKWRVLDFGYGRVYAGPEVDPKTISTGLVLRLP
jgi:hypothetical protein